MSDTTVMSAVSDIRPSTSRETRPDTNRPERRHMQDFERHLVAIGKVASNFALLEVMAGHLCGALLGTDPNAALVVTTNLNFARVLDVAGGLAHLRVADPAARGEIFRVLQLAQEAAIVRNQILHSPYAAPDDEGEPSDDVLKRVHLRSSRKKGLTSTVTDEGTDQIEAAVKQIHQAIQEIQQLPDSLDQAAPTVAQRLRELPTLG